MIPPEDEQARLRRRLREIREYLNLSQQFVAEQASMNRSAIADIERGARKVDSLELHRLARVYRYPVSYFLGDEEPSPEAASEETLNALARTATELSDSDRQEVLRFAQFLRFYGASNTRRKK
jgi:transcriptional regulator with XRE-family HTH domain